MEVKTARTAGFCFGVERAVNMLDRLIGEGKRPLYTYGPIIHNDQVVEDFASRGVEVIRSLKELYEKKPGYIVIRSHGASRREQEEMEAAGFAVVDATCPFVKKIHGIVREQGQAGRRILITGDKNHAEVQAIIGWCPTEPFVFDNEEEIPELPADTPLLLVSQTTFQLDKFKKIVEIIKKRYYNAVVVNTICHATQKRQQEAGDLAVLSDAMFVIGGSQSSNTRKLAEICEANCAKTYYIQTSNDLIKQGFKPVRVVGITAGASTPKKIIEEVQNFVRSKF